MPAFTYTPALLEGLESAFSADRLATYLRHVQDKDPTATIDDAFDLYVWNLRVAGALHGALHVLEVCVRNALHDSLSKCFSPNWIDDPSFILICIQAQYAAPMPGQKTNPPGPDVLREIYKVRNRVAQALAEKAARSRGRAPARVVNVEDVVAGVDFGFWTTLLRSRFELPLWRPALHFSFPHFTARTGKPLTRRPVEKRLNFLRDLRNRVMHHEPLFHRNLPQDFEDLYEAVGWINSDAETWLRHHCRWREVQATQALRPETF